MNHNETVRRLVTSKYTIYLASPTFSVAFIATCILNLFLPSHSFNTVVFALPFLVHFTIVGWLAARATGSHDASLKWVTVHGALVGLLSALPALAFAAIYAGLALATDQSDSMFKGLIGVFFAAVSGAVLAVSCALAICGTLAAWIGGWLGR